MKVKFTCLLLGDQCCYTVKTKEHWYSKWQYIYDSQYPRLFRLDKLIELHIISIEELEKYFRGNDSSEIIIKRKKHKNIIKPLVN